VDHTWSLLFFCVVPQSFGIGRNILVKLIQEECIQNLMYQDAIANKDKPHAYNPNERDIISKQIHHGNLINSIPWPLSPAGILALL